MNNLHFVGEWFDCRISAAVLGDPERLRTLCIMHAVRQKRAIRYEHFTFAAEAGVIGAMTTHDMHLVMRTFPRHGTVIVNLLVGDKQSTGIATSMHLVDALRDDLWPTRALWHRIQSDEASLRRSGRIPLDPTEVLLGPISTHRRPPSPSGWPCTRQPSTRVALGPPASPYMENTN